jgi:hypothetical protein
MKRFITLLLLSIGTLGFAQVPEHQPTFQGRPLSYWIDSIHERNEDMPTAFEAIQTLGPLAAAAVPELARIFDEPFSPICIGEDDNEAILQKISAIQLRSDALDSLAAIGPLASPAASALIRWALTPRVIPEAIRSGRDYRAYVDLVVLDVLERMRVVNVISGFRLEAAEQIRLLVNSNVSDERKLGVAILEGHVLPITVQLLKSADCDSRQLGLALLTDLWAVVPAEDLLQLKRVAACPVTAP